MIKQIVAASALALATSPAIAKEHSLELIVGGIGGVTAASGSATIDAVVCVEDTGHEDVAVEVRNKTGLTSSSTIIISLIRGQCMKVAGQYITVHGVENPNTTNNAPNDARAHVTIHF